MDLLPGVRAGTAETDRLRMHYLEAGPPPHLAGWSTGGGAVATYALDRPVAPVTLSDPVSPYGFGGCHRDGTPCFPRLGRHRRGARSPRTSSPASRAGTARQTRRPARATS